MVNSFCKAEDFQAISLYKDMEGVYLIKFSKEVMLQPILDPETGEMTGEMEDSGLVRYTEEILYGEPTVEEIRKIRLAELKEYDSSLDVNGFFVNGRQMWISPADRANYMITIESAGRMGLESVPFLGITLGLQQAVAMLDAINVYAMQCVGVTLVHEADLNALDTVEALLEYNIKTGYPEKLSFNLSNNE